MKRKKTFLIEIMIFVIMKMICNANCCTQFDKSHKIQDLVQTPTLKIEVEMVRLKNTVVAYMNLNLLFKYEFPFYPKLTYEKRKVQKNSHYVWYGNRNLDLN